MTEWRTIPSFSAYSASSDGDIRRDVRMHNTPAGLVSKALNDRGYWKCSVTGDDGCHRTVTVHTLVALAFLGRRPKGMVACHKDGDSKNCSQANLRYGTQSSNIADALKHRTYAMGTRHPGAKLDDNKVREIRRLCAEGELRQKDIGARYSVSQRCIWQIYHRKRWRHVA